MEFFSENVRQLLMKISACVPPWWVCIIILTKTSLMELNSESFWQELTSLSAYLPPCWVWIITTTLVAAVLYYCYIVLPMNYVKDLSDVGFNYLLDNRGMRKNKSKKDLVQEVRRLRKIGRLPPVYPNGWFVLLESPDLLPGTVKHVAALGENFAVFRTQEGTVYILDAYCPHLGANMAVGGAVRGDCLECPFHEWKFSGIDGKCTGISYSTRVPDFAKVKSWKCCEVNDLIFVWYHAEGQEPNWYPPTIDKVQNKEWRYKGRNEFIINAHIQEIPENGGDVQHLNVVHKPSLLAGSDLRFSDRLRHKFACHKWDNAQWQPSDNPETPHRATMTLHHKVELFQRWDLVSMDVRAEQIGPAYVELYLQSPWGEMAITQCVTPIEPLLQRVIHRIYCPPKLFAYATFVFYGESVMFERDIMIWNHKKYIDRPILVREDQMIRRHRRWYSQFYSDSSPTFSFQKDSLDW